MTAQVVVAYGNKKGYKIFALLIDLSNQDSKKMYHDITLPFPIFLSLSTSMYTTIYVRTRQI